MANIHSSASPCLDDDSEESDGGSSIMSGSCVSCWDVVVCVWCWRFEIGVGVCVSVGCWLFV